jgi:hypothetical protein
VHGGHADDERKQVVDESVHEPEAQKAPRQVRHRLEVVVNEQLGVVRQRKEADTKEIKFKWLRTHKKRNERRNEEGQSLEMPIR